VIGYNNTIVNAGWRRPTIKGGSIWVEVAVRAELYNNLLANDRFGIKCDPKNPKDSRSKVSNNLYYGATPDGVTGFQTTSEILAGTNDIISKTVGDNDPKFANYPLTTDSKNATFNTAWDFRLQSGSPAIGKGTTSFTRLYADGLTFANGTTYKSPAPSTTIGAFGTYSGKKEIESIAVDNELGYVYYSDEGVGVRKYYADPERGNAELALFAKTGFSEDHEGISIYKTGPKTGYLLVSDQGANQFHIFRREGESGNPNEYKLLKIVKVASQISDGSDVTNVPLGKQFPHGLFVAMSEGKTFHYYRWEDIAGKDLK
jgi:hypothetical protein